MNKFKRKKLIEKFYAKTLDLNFYLDAPFSPLGPRGDGAKQCFCVEAHHLFKEIKEDLENRKERFRQIELELQEKEKRIVEIENQKKILQYWNLDPQTGI